MGKGKKKGNKNNPQGSQETGSTSQTVNPVVSPTSSVTSPSSTVTSPNSSVTSLTSPPNLPPVSAASPTSPVPASGTSTVTPDSENSKSRRSRKKKNQQVDSSGAGQRPDVQVEPPRQSSFSPQHSYAGAGQRPGAQPGPPGQQMSYAGPPRPQMSYAGPPGQQMSYAGAGQRSGPQSGPPGPQMSYAGPPGPQMSYAGAGQRPAAQAGPPGQQMSYAGAGQRPAAQAGPPGQQMSYAGAGQRSGPQAGPPGPQMSFAGAGAGQRPDAQAIPRNVPDSSTNPVSHGPSQGRTPHEQPIQGKPQQSSERRESQASGRSSLTKSSFLIPKRQNQSEQQRKGKRIQIATNHFALSINLKQSKAIHYDVEIEPDKPKKLFMEIFLQYFDKYFPKHKVAFDGMKNMYSPVSLPLKGKDHQGTVEYLEPGRTRPTEYKVKIQFASEIDLTKLMQYFSTGTSQEPPQNALQCLDVVLRHPSVHKLTKIGRCFFSLPPNPIDLGGGLDLWYGHFQSVILGWKPFFNLDVAHKGFTKQQNVLYLLDELDDTHREKCSKTGRASPETLQNLRRYIRNLKVVFQIPNQAASKRIINVKDLAEPPKAVKFKMEDGKQSTVYDYFLNEKKYKYKKMFIDITRVVESEL